VPKLEQLGAHAVSDLPYLTPEDLANGSIGQLLEQRKLLALAATVRLAS